MKIELTMEQKDRLLNALHIAADEMEDTAGYNEMVDLAQEIHNQTRNQI